MIAPTVEMAQTHAAQLRRDADVWRERRLARRGTALLTAARAARAGREPLH